MMWPWPRPRPPVKATEKAWVEVHLQQLADGTGAAMLLRNEMIIPDHRLVRPDQSAAAQLPLWTERLCRSLRLDPQEVTFEPGLAAPPADDVGTPLRGVKLIGDLESDPPGPLLVQLAWQLAGWSLEVHCHWKPTAPGIDQLTQLYLIYAGVGLLVPGCVDQPATCSQCDHGPTSESKVASLPPPLPARVIGYALALYQWLRQERETPWAGWLSRDALAALEQGLRYLNKTGESLCTRDSLQIGSPPVTVERVRQRMTSRQPSARVAGLWLLRDLEPEQVEEISDVVIGCLTHRSAEVRSGTAIALGHLPTVALQAADLLEYCLRDDPDLDVRAAAAAGLRAVLPQRPETVAALATALGSEDRSVVAAASQSLRAAGEQGTGALPNLLVSLRAALLKCDHPLVDQLVETLYALEPDPTDRVLTFFADDAELQQQAVHMIAHANPTDADPGDSLA